MENLGGMVGLMIVAAVGGGFVFLVRWVLERPTAEDKKKYDESVATGATMHCKICGCEIQPQTWNKTGGFCMPCSKGTR